MLQALQVFSKDHVFTVDVVDVDGDAALVAKYDELVPVLCGIRNGEAAVQLCHYFLDENKVSAFLQPADG